LGVDLTHVEALALSHGHPDHVGGLEELMKRVGRKGIGLVLHPAVFRTSRYMKMAEDFKAYYPSLTREKFQAAGINIIETKKPYPLLAQLHAFF